MAERNGSGMTRRGFAVAGLTAGLAGTVLGAGFARADNPPMPPELREAIERQPFAPVFGNPQGDITLTEFFDYNCPYCRKGYPDLVALIREDAKLRVVLREWPIFGEDSLAATRVSLATLRQGGYAAFHASMMAVKGRAGEALALRVAREGGLDLDRIRADMRSAEVEGHIERSMALGDHMALAGTPTYIAGNGGAFGHQRLKDLRALVAQARKEML